MSNVHRVLVTGGSGFIGTNLVARLLATSGVEVLSLDKRTPKTPTNRRVHQVGDLLDGAEIQRIVDSFRPTHVVHLAARTDLDGASLDDYTENTVGTANLIAALKGSPWLRRVIFASSRLVCEIGYLPTDEYDVMPSHPYGSSKVEMEKLIRESLPASLWVIVRPTSIWGPWFSVPYADFFTHVLAGRYVHPRGTRVRKSFGYVENTVEQLVSLMDAADSEMAGRTLYLADYEPIEVFTFASSLAQRAGAPRVREVPLWALRAAGRLGDIAQESGLYKHPPLTTFRLSNLCTDMVFDMSPMKAIAPLLPFDQLDGINRTLSWLRGNDR
jgi:nucleoside-diphosphate-sugar epimerase